MLRPYIDNHSSFSILMKTLCQLALDTAAQIGASYADIRLVTIRNEYITVRNGKIAEMELEEDAGFGVRVIKNGAWGFAASNDISKAGIDKTAALAVKIAQASASLKAEDVRLSEETAHRAVWSTTYLIDPFEVPLERKVDLLMAVDEILRKDKRIAAAEASLRFKTEHQLLLTSEGAFIDQKLMQSSGGYSATAVENSEVQVRSYPNSFRGQCMSAGYELIDSLKLAENAERVREEASALLSADPCPARETALILDGSQLSLQIHESVGHPTELDRVLGMEESFAGSSFATTEKLGNFRYGSDIVNLVCDNTIPGGMATFGFDDDGVRAQRWHIVRDGIFAGYQTNRALADKIGAARSTGSNRADGWRHIPMIRIGNLSLEPGEWTLEDLIADTGDGIYMETNRMWSIDQRRLNFQFGCELGWEIKNGKKTRLLKNPSYQGSTPEFWGSCDAICNRDYWTLWGIWDCGKGQPMQTAEMSHGAAPARFNNIKVGISG